MPRRRQQLREGDARKRVLVVELAGGAKRAPALLDVVGTIGLLRGGGKWRGMCRIGLMIRLDQTAITTINLAILLVNHQQFN